MGKKKKTSKKTRITELRVDFGKHVDVELAPLDHSGTITFIDGLTKIPVFPNSIQSGVVYPRENKHPKVIIRSNQSSSTIFIDQNRNLLRYKNVFAVDTNTAPNTGISVTVVMWLNNIEFVNNEWIFTPQYPPAFVFCGKDNSPEKIGWHNTILRVQFPPGVEPPIALIVDSSLGELDAINKRNIPLIDTVFLPEGVDLVYASSDAGTQEHIGNLALKECDKIAGRILKREVLEIGEQGFFYHTISLDLLAG